MGKGHLNCRSCGAQTDCADLVSGFCPHCAQEHIDALSSMCRAYAEYCKDGTKSAQLEALVSYTRSEAERLDKIFAHANSSTV
jgi:hypothetical protein